MASSPLISRKHLKQALLFLMAVLVCFMFLFWFFSAKNTNQDLTGYEAYLEKAVGPKIQLGDWVLREGTGYESQLIKQLSGSHYSHIGVVSQVKPTIQLIHATTDDDPEHPNQVIVSSLAEFTQTKWANSWAIYRNTSLTPKQINESLHSLHQSLGQHFVIDVKENNPKYCTTIIYDSLPISMQSQLLWKQVSLTVMKGEILFPNAFIELKDTKLIYRN